MNNYRIELELVPTKPLRYSSNCNGKLSNIDKLSEKGVGHKGFFLSGGNGKKKTGCWFDGSFKFFNKQKGYNGFLGNSLSKEDGTFTKEQIITVSSDQSIDTLTIYFDKQAGEYATQVQINGTIYNNNSYIMIIKNLPASTSFSIKILKWSKINSVVKILAIKSGMVLSYDKYSLQGITFTNEYIAGNELMNFGIVTQSGQFTVKDNGELLAANNAELLNIGAQVLVYKDDQVVQRYIANNFDTDEYNLKWTIDLADDISNWEEEKVETLDYASRSLEDLLHKLLPVNFIYDNMYTSQIVKSIMIPNSYLLNSTKWQAIVKCCTIGLLRVYQINGIVHVRRII